MMRENNNVITWHGLSEEDIVEKNIYGTLDVKCLEAADSYEDLAHSIPDDDLLRRIRIRMKATGLDFKKVRDMELNCIFEKYKEIFPQFTIDDVEHHKASTMDKFMNENAIGYEEEEEDDLEME